MYLFFRYTPKPIVNNVFALIINLCFIIGSFFIKFNKEAVLTSLHICIQLINFMPSNNKNNDVNTAIAKKFKMVRKVKGLSLVEVGQILQISPQQVQKYEACQSKIPFSRLLIFANALGVSPQFFFESEAGK